jgi:hypothetical protein
MTEKDDLNSIKIILIKQKNLITKILKSHKINNIIAHKLPEIKHTKHSYQHLFR